MDFSVLAKVLPALASENLSVVGHSTLRHWKGYYGCAGYVKELDIAFAWVPSFLVPVSPVISVLCVFIRASYSTPIPEFLGNQRRALLQLQRSVPPGNSPVYGFLVST